jgi:hypothetical protein
MIAGEQDFITFGGARVELPGKLMREIVVANSGVGPALIESFEDYYDGKRCEGKSQLKWQQLLTELANRRDRRN